jgi:hypothetical protein
MIIANPLDANDPIVQKMLNRLQRAIVDDDMRHQMDIEDEFERILARENKKVADEKDQIIAEKDYALAEKDHIIADTAQALEAEKTKVELLMKQLAEFQQKTK